MINWDFNLDEMPTDGRVLIHCDCYNDESMRVRIVDAKFLKYMDDITCFSLINEPLTSMSG